LIAAFLLTVGRAKEVLWLRLQDVSTDRKTVTFRPNEFHEGRRLKTKTSKRIIPLRPQLAEILIPFLDQRAIEGGKLLFRSPHITDREAPLTEGGEWVPKKHPAGGAVAPKSRTIAPAA
jgi:integrase